MTTLVKLIKLLYPFVQEFGFKEVNIKQFIIQNKTISYLLLVCFVMFIMFIYALEQAHIRMLNRPIFLDKQNELQQIIIKKDEQLEQLELICFGNLNTDGTDDKNIDDALQQLMESTNEE